jgi:ectoine hydroxylase-related dioxygenase (phytanoyl-CoA dioxygenase family)
MIMRSPHIVREAHRLRDQGYAILRRVVEPDQVLALDDRLEPVFASTPFCRGGFYGEETKRFGGLLARDPGVEAFVMHPLILSLAEEMLAPWCNTLQLNITQAISIHPGALPQFPHRDQDMWGGPKGEVEYLVNVMWPFTPYRSANGATLIWPGTHGRAALQENGFPGDPIVAECEPGDAILFLGSTLHAAGGNASAEVRRGMIIGYSLGWLRTYENQYLVYPPPVASRFPEPVQKLIGYAQHRPNLGNVEGRCPSELLRGRLEGPAEDALRPEQVQAVEAFAAAQHRELLSIYRGAEHRQ